VRFAAPLQPARFVRREKRFLVHAVLPCGTPVVAHTNNTGRMTGLLAPGATVWLSRAAGTRRRLAWTLEVVEAPGAVAVGVNTALANVLAAEAIAAGVVAELAGAGALRREVRCGIDGARLDILLEPGTWVEVKNVTLIDGSRALFPDAVTARGRRHLDVLARLAAAGDRSVLLWIVQRGDAESAGPADAVDPGYGAALRAAAAAGVEVLAYGARVAPDVGEIVVERRLEVAL